MNLSFAKPGVLKLIGRPPAKRKTKRPKKVVIPYRKPEKDPKAAHALDVIRAFGGVPELVAALARVGLVKHRACIYRWLLAYPRGCSGRVPPKAWREVQVAARISKVSLKRVRMIPLRPAKNKYGVWTEAAKGWRT